MYYAATTQKIGHKLVKETKKKMVAREKAEEAERKAAGDNIAKAAQHDDEDSDGAIDPTLEDGWLVPETRVMRRKAVRMRGARSNSVERLEDDDLNHISAERPYFKSGKYMIPHPFGRKLIEDR